MINFASTEQHSLHLPVGTDAFLGAAVTERAAELCHRPVLLLPQVCFGYSPHHRFAPGYVTMPQHLLKEYAVSICENVIANGFSQMFLVNSHGGNQVYLSAAVNEIGEKHGTGTAVLGCGARANQRHSGIGAGGHGPCGRI